uniref:Uncharacterized protein n=1 Tax=Triticum urartu TaxID=4572 RepID=A0A8R7Q1R4_TRIUA
MIKICGIIHVKHHIYFVEGALYLCEETRQDPRFKSTSGLKVCISALDIGYDLSGTQAQSICQYQSWRHF